MHREVQRHVRWRTEVPRSSCQSVRVPATSSNLLIHGLTSAARDALLSDAEPVALRAGDRLAEPGQPLTHAYFPLDAVISAGCGARGDHPGCGVIGREGLVGIELIHEISEVEFPAEVQCPGAALRVGASSFRRQLSEQPAFHVLMKRYAFVRLMMVSQDVHCFSHHLLENRLASQLLTAMARGGSNHLALTHQMLARVLDVRRSGITLAAAALRDKGMVRYARGNIEILDGQKLVSLACSCYAANLKTYARLLGIRPRSE